MQLQAWNAMPDIYQDCTQIYVCSVLLGFRTNGRANSPMGSRPWCQTPCSGVCWHGLKDPGLEAAQPTSHAAEECACCSSRKEREQLCICELETLLYQTCILKRACYKGELSKAQKQYFNFSSPEAGFPLL